MIITYDKEIMFLLMSVFCLLAGLLQNCRSVLYEILWNDFTEAWDQLIGS